MSEKSDAEEHLEDVLVVVQLLSNEISMSDSLRPQLDTILSRIPLEMMEKVNGNAVIIFYYYHLIWFKTGITQH